MNDRRDNVAAQLVPTAYELDVIYGVPRLLHSRTILIATLWIAAMSIALALEWPRFWQRIALVDLAATSILFALAAGRQWLLRPVQYRYGRPSLSAAFIRRVSVGAGWIAAFLVIVLAISAIKPQPPFGGFAGMFRPGMGRSGSANETPSR